MKTNNSKYREALYNFQQQISEKQEKIKSSECMIDAIKKNFIEF